jgi:phenylacetate-CoA ligase
MYVLQGQNSFFSEFKKLNDVQYGDVRELDDIQNKKIRSIIDYAYNNTHIYHELFKTNKISPESIKTKEDLTKLPILTKKRIRANFPDNVTSKSILSRAIYDTTSGSTGDPLEYFHDKRTEPFRTASFMFFNTWMGVKPFDRHWNLKSLGKLNYKRKMWNWLTQKYLYSVMDVKKDRINEIVSNINEINPNYIEGYTGSLVKFAKYLDESRFELGVDIKAAIATSENLSLTNRELLERVFDCKVFNRYGSREFCGGVAQECSDFEGLHVNPLLCYVEIVDDKGESVDVGQMGKILITDLNNYVMPFIRYEIGDLGILGSRDNSCGRSFQTIKSIEGRAGEFIISSSGESIPFITVSAYLFRRNYAAYAYTYQFVQEEPGEITLKIVPTPKYNEIIEAQINESLNMLLDGFRVTVEIVGEIPPSKTGKTPFLKRL